MNLCSTLRFVLWFSACVAVMVSSGCEKEEGLPEFEQGQPNYADEGFGNALKLLDSGDEPAAVEAFVASDPGTSLSGSGVPVLGLSEAQFGRLSRAQRSAAHDLMTQFMADVKALARACAAQAERANREGDHAKATIYLDAIRRLGERLRDGDYLTPIQQTGNALIGLSEARASERTQ